MIMYLIEIEGKYFKDFIHNDNKVTGHAGTHTNCGIYEEPVELDLTDNISDYNLFTSFSVGQKITNILKMDKYREKNIKVLPTYKDETTFRRRW